jgi:Ca2+-binding RTX toxin-like protein
MTVVRVHYGDLQMQILNLRSPFNGDGEVLQSSAAYRFSGSDLLYEVHGKNLTYSGGDFKGGIVNWMLVRENEGFLEFSGFNVGGAKFQSWVNGAKATAFFTGADTIYGGIDGDWIEGYQGNDLLYGGWEDDLVFGGPGNDTVIGGTGQDILRGGLGRDRFKFVANVDSRPEGREDEIDDFVRTQGDKIDLQAIDANLAAAGNQAVTWIGARDFTGARGQLRYEQNYLSGDTNGDGDADFSVRVDLLRMIATDFIL